MYRGTTRRLVCVCLLAWATPLLAQQLPLKIYSTKDGLPYNGISHILSDSSGFLWFCTGDGLSRFDGRRFLNIGGEQGITYPQVNDLIEKRRGIYWIATNGGGVVRFDANSPVADTSSTSRMRRFTVSSEQATNRVNVLLRGRNGVMWLGTDGGLFALAEIDGQVKVRRIELRLNSHPDLLIQVWAIVEDPAGSMWLGTRFGLIRLLPDGRTIHYPVQPHLSTDHVWALLLDRNGTLWIGHESGLLLFNPPSAESIPLGRDLNAGRRDDTLRAARDAGLRVPGSGLVERPRGVGDARLLLLERKTRRITSTGFHEFADGRIWIAGRPEGLYEVSGQIVRKVNSDPVLQEFTGNIAEDRDGNLWLGTVANGAVKIAQRGFVAYGPSEGVGPGIQGIVADEKGTPMVLAGGWQIGRLDGGRFSTETITTLGPAAAGDSWAGPRSMMRDRSGEWWIGTKAGLYRFPKVDADRLPATVPKAVYTMKDGLIDDRVTQLYEDSRGDIWIFAFAPKHELMTRWERSTSRFITYSDRDGLPAFNAPNWIGEDRSGEIWLSFREGGLARYRSGRFQYFAEAQGVPAGQLTSCFLDSKDRLWCGNSQRGLMRFDTRAGPHLTPVVYTTRDGLSRTMVTAIGEDTEGRIYAGSQQGVDEIETVSNRIHRFNGSDGLSGGSIIHIFRDRQGTMWFSTFTGVSRLIGRPVQSAAGSPLLIDGVRIAGVTLGVPALGVTDLHIPDLSAGNNSIEIDYLRVSFAAGNGFRYEYKLEGAGGGWSEPTAMQTVNYPGLPPGQYRFVVRAIGSDDPSAATAAVSFRILPPIWRRWWALSLFALLAGFTVLAIERYRAARVRELGAALRESQALTQALNSEQSALRDSEERFRTLAETASDAIITIDESGRIAFVNSAAQHVFGYTEAEMLGIDMAVLIPAYRERLHLVDVSNAAWKPVEIPGVTRDGRELPLELSFAEFMHEGQRFFTGVARDISERKRADEALRRSREERIAELDRVRRRIATDLHDDIGSSLTQISVLSEVVQRRLDQPDQTMSGHLDYISRASRELIESMSDIVWAINPQRDRLSHLVHRMRRFAANTFTACNIEFRMVLPAAEDDMRLEGNLRREIFLIFKESVNNIVRHSGCTSADLELTFTLTHLNLMVKDDGCGFDPAQEGDGHGLASMRNRALDIGAVFEFESAPGSGTTIRVMVPLPEQRDYENS